MLSRCEEIIPTSNAFCMERLDAVKQILAVNTKGPALVLKQEARSFPTARYLPAASPSPDLTPSLPLPFATGRISGSKGIAGTLCCRPLMEMSHVQYGPMARVLQEY